MFSFEREQLDRLVHEELNHQRRSARNTLEIRETGNSSWLKNLILLILKG